MTLRPFLVGAKFERVLKLAADLCWQSLGRVRRKADGSQFCIQKKWEFVRSSTSTYYQLVAGNTSRFHAPNLCRNAEDGCSTHDG